MIGEAAVHRPGMEDVELVGHHAQNPRFAGVEVVFHALKALIAGLPVAEKVVMGAGNHHHTS